MLAIDVLVLSSWAPSNPYNPAYNPIQQAKISSMCDAAKQQSNDVENNSLKLAVKTSLAKFLSARLSSNCDIAQDVYRAMRDEANLLLERQVVADALDSDPFELMKVSSSVAENNEEEEKIDDSVLRDKKKNRAMIERFKVS